MQGPRAGLSLAVIAAQAVVFLWALWMAYRIRMYAIEEYGTLIHEFDPWFNYRATEYMAQHGLKKFFQWYDYMSWYPLGRPVGTTIFPGMQMTAVWIWEALKHMPESSIKIAPGIGAVLNPLLDVFRNQGWILTPIIPAQIEFGPMSLNDVCCYIGPWCAVPAAFFTGALTYEVTRSRSAAIATVWIMAIIPAHLMRSVGGEFDNEAVGMWSICCTFWCWCRSIRTPSSWWLGVFTGLSYAYMVAAWGGFIFVLNMVGLHALMLVGLGRFNTGVYRAYSLFYVIGTALVVQIPVVGWTPLKSMEQVGPLGVFLGYQVLQYCDNQRRARDMDTKEFVAFRIRMVLVLAGAVALVFVAGMSTGVWQPFGSRIRGLFVKHTLTGNPLVDSVAEHQPATAAAYQASLHKPLELIPIGFVYCLVYRNNASWFILLYAVIARHFSLKMSRLLLICAPICSILAGIAVGCVADFVVRQFDRALEQLGEEPKEAAPKETKESNGDKGKAGKDGKKKKEAKPQRAPPRSYTPELREWENEYRPGGMAEIFRGARKSFVGFIPGRVHDAIASPDREISALGIGPIGVRLGIASIIVSIVLLFGGAPTKEFMSYCDQYSHQLGNPMIVYKAYMQSGEQVMVKDYLHGYEWIKANTPEDSRVMAWWDYGYQITGIANRTTIADGNTWNHEHIATLGRMLTSPEKKAHKAIRHLADYVLVWGGGRGDDLAKSPHLARIANSIFPDHCGDKDPRCNSFGFMGKGQPTPMMAESLLYKLVRHGLEKDVKLNPKLFQLVHDTRFGLMRVYKVMNVSQESKDWLADPTNRVCDAPGSWYCTGQYPPAIAPLIAKRQNFAQLEDFNKQGEKSAYTKMIEKELER